MPSHGLSGRLKNAWMMFSQFTVILTVIVSHIHSNNPTPTLLILSDDTHTDSCSDCSTRIYRHSIGLVFAKTGSFNSGIGRRVFLFTLCNGEVTTFCFGVNQSMVWPHQKMRICPCESGTNIFFAFSHPNSSIFFNTREY